MEKVLRTRILAFIAVRYRQYIEAKFLEGFKKNDWVIQNNFAP